jgi:putative transposase
MPRKGRSNEEIVHALGQVEAGEKVTEVCRPLGVSEQTVYRWKKQFAGLGVQELRELRSLRDENRKLKQVVKSSGTASPGPRTSSVDVPAEYRSLHKYLDGRYADTAVLKFAEIEDLLGFAVPVRASGKTGGRMLMPTASRRLSHSRGFTLRDRQRQPAGAGHRLRARRSGKTIGSSCQPVKKGDHTPRNLIRLLLPRRGRNLHAPYDNC